MAEFDIAIKYTLKHEGGYNDIKEDRGGATNYGISLAFYKSNVDKIATNDTIKNLTELKAKEIYKKYFWDINKFDDLRFQNIANKLFDMCVNIGNPRVIKWCQEIMQLSLIDGISGTLTIYELNLVEPQEFIDAIIKKQKEHYNNIVNKNPNQSIFLKGWLKRAEYRG